ncbi:MAG: UDP-4-amino-4,6-dideoxy-N-acetyl-beta-L-altrosami ne N-acetyltransferase [Bacteroidales bacterium]
MGNNIKIGLRAMEPGDIDRMYQWENDPDLWDAGHTLAPYSRFQLEQYVLNYSGDVFGTGQLRLMIDIIDNDTAETVGMIDLYEVSNIHRRAGVGIMVIPSARKKGVAAQALRQLSAYCDKKLQLNQLWCEIETSNTASIRLFENEGFEKTGTKKMWIRVEKNYRDVYFFQKILIKK